jgi:predicted acylesterase/phospholipase RssA
MSPETQQKTFERIALCLSGGGYRASAFHFGSIDMLDELGLLDNIKMLSTASGGTITAVAYALSKVEGRPFEEFFTSFKTFLGEVNVVKEALDRSCDTLDQNKDAEISLVRFAAEIYQEKLFKNEKKDLGIFIDAVDKPFEELIFNSVELNLGNSFRFRASHRPAALIGNQSFNLSTTKDIARKILLGDIIAASSCFPGVFDPFIFPDDFHFDAPAEVKRSLKSGFKDGDKNISLPIMDGGIFDNQGVDSILMANEKDKNGEPVYDPIDVFVISDSNPLNEDLFPAPMPTRKIPYLSAGYTESPLLEVTTNLAKRVRWWANLFILGAFILLAAGVACLVSMGQFVSQNYAQIVKGIPGTILSHAVAAGIVLGVSLACIAALFILFWLKKRVSRAQGFINDHNDFTFGTSSFGLWVFIKKLTLTGLVRILEGRVRSSLALLTDVFLKRVRSLGTKVLLSDPAMNRLVAFNYINDLDTSVHRPQLWIDDGDLKPSPEMSRISEKAGHYQTNLWFDSTEDLEGLIMSGQMVICLSILKQLWARWRIDVTANAALPKPSSPDSEFNALYTKVKEKWMEFKTGKRTSYRRIVS